MLKYIFLASTAVVVTALTILILVLPSPGQTNTNAIDTLETIPNGNNVVFTNIDVFDGNTIALNQTVVVTEGLIETVDARLNISRKDGYKVVNGEGLTLIPGIIDAHTHSYDNALTDALRFGVTTHLDMFGIESSLKSTLKTRETLSQTLQTDLYSAGTLATVPGGHGTQFGFPIDTIETLDEIASWVSARKQAGADYIKLVYMPYQTHLPSLNRQFALEVINQGKRQGMMVLAHVSTHQAAQDMIEDGINGLVHVFADKIASDEIITLAKQKGIFIIPTLAVIASAEGRGFGTTLSENSTINPYLSSQQKSTLRTSYGIEIPGYSYAIAKQNVRLFNNAGVPILSGSDAPNPGTAFGISALHEITLLVDAGLSPEQALTSATYLPAGIFSLHGRGKIIEGARADLVVLENNPLDNINALYDINAIYKNGFKVTRVKPALLSQNNPNINKPILGDFEIDDTHPKGLLGSIEGFMWNVSDDSIINGKSTAIIQVVSMPGIDGQTSNVLKVSALVNTGFPYPWSGTSVADFVSPIEGKNVSAYSHLVFDVKGSQGTYRAMSFDARTTGVPPSQDFVVSTQWQTVKLPLSSFSGFDNRSLSGFAFVAGPQTGEFEFYLDNVKVE